METKLISHKTLKLVQENEHHMHEIEEILKKDKRYLILDYMPEERTKLIMTYLEDLDKRGPPPPPTASEPTRRPAKTCKSEWSEITVFCHAGTEFLSNVCAMGEFARVCSTAWTGPL
ncbi:hypothetical protein PR048_001659 [Dryococelus australis]|uniref:Uncharacterized protein n=1 Tax=Dryococelus australis TaxID=614101 RepID=A0ABQ9IHZ1_9NEOP|nr:hypothetical protein PR048_001659 [Dryococelus australis]